MERITLASGTAAAVVRTPGAQVGAVVIPDLFGLRPLFEDLAGDLAAHHGWSVAVIDQFAGRPLGPEPDPRFAAIPDLEDDRLLGDVALASDALGAERRACIGFCMGGMYALKAASTGSLDRCVAFYGMIRIPEAWKGPTHREPLELLLGRTAPTQVLAIVGGHDTWTPPEDVAALAEVDGVTVVEYPDAEHGFVHDASRPAHRPDDAADAWSRVKAFLES